MLRTLCSLVLIAGCSIDDNDLQGGSPPPPVHNPLDTDEPNDTGTSADTDTTTLRDGCFADVEVDSNDDGSIDTTGLDTYDPVRTDLILRSIRDGGLFVYVFDYAYDTDGYLVRFSYDYGLDGDDDYVAVYTRDADHNIVLYEIDDDGDGDLEATRAYTWNEDGEVLTYSQDDDADGDPDYSYTATYVDGLRVSSTEDEDGDEITDIWYVYTNDAAGRIARVDGDRGNDGTIDYVGIRTYTDPVLSVGSTWVDDDNDGVADLTNTFAFDAAERLLMLEEDDGADLFVDFLGTYTYEANGDYATFDEETFFPPPADDFVDVTHEEFTYDDQGRLVELFDDGQYTDASVSYDRLARTTWVFGGSCP